MEKLTLQFQSIIKLAKFSKLISAGYLINTSKFTLTGKFTPDEVELATKKYNALIIETTEKVYTYS